jgi:hypothetical protein
MATITVTAEQVLEEVESLGTSLANIFIIEDDDVEEGVIVLWYPAVGLRSLIIEDEALAKACHDYLRNTVGVRRFKSWEELSEVQQREKWEGWDTCADYRRHLETARELMALPDRNARAGVLE